MDKNPADLKRIRETLIASRKVQEENRANCHPGAVDTICWRCEELEAYLKAAKAILEDVHGSRAHEDADWLLNEMRHFKFSE